MVIIHEIFKTIQGEGYDTGLPCTFVRLFGCNLKCTYCDQPQKSTDAKAMSVESIIQEVKKLDVKNVCITGGEPLIQEECYVLIENLDRLGYNVSIETNGSVLIPRNFKRGYKYVMDIKCPSSKVHDKNILTNLTRLNSKDEVKFVIADRRDYNFMKDVLNALPTKAKILLSPMFDPNLKQTIGKDLCEWMLEDHLEARIQIQLHKILGVI